uniref:Chromosome 10 open reading frame 90 n=1 Tax=Strix occidentalis caurina TaxID=311401 RepID=A0A8D0EPE0_STROC
MISPIVISQMIDENKSKENWPALPMQSTIPQPSAYHTKQSLANHGSNNINRAFMVLPSRLEIQASLDDTTSSSDSPAAEEKQCQNQQKGFASITVTARRVAPGSDDPARGPGAVQEPNATSPTSSRVPPALHLWSSPSHASQRASPLKISESCSQLGEEPRKQLFHPGNKNSMGFQSSDGREKVPPSFISCVHLQVSQQCPNTIYYLDKSLNVCIDQPRIKCQKIHRSTLSFNINCSLSRLTADGVDGIANGEPIAEIFQTKLLGENKTPLRSNLSADLTENNVINKEKTNEGSLGSKYPLQSVFVSELPAFVDIPRGPNNVVTAKKDDVKQSGRTQMLSGSKKQQCTMGRSSTTASGSLPDTTSRKAIAAATDGSSKKTGPSKGTSKSKEIQAEGILKPKMSVSSSMCNIKASSRILSEENVHRQNQLLKSKEALEIHKPQFISRSQERLKRLEHMVQLRKAQQSDAPANSSNINFIFPLLDNLFRPKERFIPEKEMHMRSKRIYNNLPEVKKKQEEKQKRIIIQSNRLRVEIFKKVRISCECHV